MAAQNYNFELTYDSIPAEHRELFWEYLTNADYVLHQNTHWPPDTPKFTEYIVFWRPAEGDEDDRDLQNHIREHNYVIYTEIQITTDSYDPRSRINFTTSARVEPDLELANKWPTDNYRGLSHDPENNGVLEIGYEIYWYKKTRDFINELNDPSWIVFKFFQDHPRIFRGGERMAAVTLDRFFPYANNEAFIRGYMEQRKRRRSKKRPR